MRALDVWILATLSLATFGEGGATPLVMLAWHAMVGLAFMAELWSEGEHTPARAVSLSAAGFCLLVAFGVWRAPYAYGAVLVALEITACLALAWVAARRGPVLLALAQRVLPWVVALHGLRMLAQSYFEQESRPASTFLNPNHLAAWSGAVLLLALSRRDLFSKSKTVWVWLPPAVAALVLSGSRGAWLGFAVGAAWLFWRTVYRLDRRRLVAVGLVCGVVSLVAATVVVNRIANDPFPFHRLGIWQSSAELFAESPLWGTGPGQFADLTPQVRFDDSDPPFRFDRSFTTTHSDLLRLPAEFGTIAAALFVALVVSVIGRIRQRLKEPGSAGIRGASAGLLALAVQGLVDNPSSWPAAYLLVAFLVGVSVSVPSPAPVRALPAVRLAAGSLALGLFVIADLLPTVAWLSLQKVPAHGPSGIEERAALARAIELNPHHPEAWYRKAHPFVFADGPFELEQYLDARVAAETAVRLAPSRYRYHWLVARVEMAACLRGSCDRPTADRTILAFERAAALSPLDPRLRIEQAEFHLAIGEIDQAARLIDGALELEPNAIPALLTRAACRVAAGAGPEEIEATLKEARLRAHSLREQPVPGEYARELLRFDESRAAALLASAKSAEVRR